MKIKDFFYSYPTENLTGEKQPPNYILMKIPKLPNYPHFSKQHDPHKVEEQFTYISSLGLDSILFPLLGLHKP